MLEFLAAPFVASLILTGIHAYLGVHVVERGVIFVDLSLAQIAALLRQAGVALKAADLRATIGELVENGLLTISSSLSRNAYRAVSAG